MWVKRELMFALQQERFETQIVPVLYESCDFEYFSWVLPSLQLVNFQESFEEGCSALLRLWGVGYKAN